MFNPALILTVINNETLYCTAFYRSELGIFDLETTQVKDVRFSFWFTDVLFF
jgi:hypothetical protein